MTRGVRVRMLGVVNCSLNLGRLLWIDGSGLHSGTDKSGSTGNSSKREDLFPVGDKKASWTVVVRELKFNFSISMLGTSEKRHGKE